jgi:2-dehydropantoate 2-reductase
MNKKKSILIVGTGALATYFAACFSRSGGCVKILGGWPEGLNALNNLGAWIEGETEGYRIFSTNDPLECTGCRYVLILVKSWQTRKVAYQLRKCVDENSLVITLQNGLGNLEALRNVLDRTKIVQCVTTMGVTLIGPGKVRLAGKGPIYMENSDFLTDFMELLKVSGFQVNQVPSILPYVWGKLIINSALNPITALLRISNGKILALPAVRYLFEQLVLESSRVASAMGINLPFTNTIEAAVDVVNQTDANYSSMLQDILRGSITEIDSINGEIIHLASSSNLQAPINSAISELIKAIPVRGNIR